MTRARPLYTPIPRNWDEYQVSARLGRGVTWFRSHRDQLEAKGFPAYDDFLGGWDADAIELWFDKRSGIAGADHADDGINRRLEAMRHG